jgi:arsenate reductase
MAEGLAKFILADCHDIRSAGSSPASEVHSEAIKSLNEIGIDISNHLPKSIEVLDKNFINNLDFAILLCAEEECPLPPKSMKVLSWLQLDPAMQASNSTQIKNSFNNVRDNIIELLKDFKSQVE